MKILRQNTWLLMSLLLIGWWTSAYSLPQPQAELSQADNSELTRARADNGYTLHITTREVVVEVVARDHGNHPVNDLNEADFEVSEGGQKSTAQLRRISGFRVIDPASQQNPESPHEGAVVLPLGGRCEIRSTVHYELAFHPENWTSGVHTIRVTTTRKHVTLSYRTQFYVGVTEIAQLSPPVQQAQATSSELSSAACYHPDVPSSIALGVVRVENSDPRMMHFDLTIPPESLPLAGIDESSRHVQLEYAICSFSRSGRIIGLWASPLDLDVTAAQQSAVLSSGWHEVIDVPHRGNPALVRLVVREPRSGNLGTIDLMTEVRGGQTISTASAPRQKRLLLQDDDGSERVGGHHSLGSVVPAPGALCGDVYELPSTTALLPSDFRALNSVGAVFTDSLNVPERALQQGIPGSTPKAEWFGVDYYGEFWVKAAGKYDFVLNADDGADLYIDDHLLINDDGIHPPQMVAKTIHLSEGRHTIHLPYFEGPKYVSLTLQVKPPDGILDVFDVRDYARPAQLPAGSDQTRGVSEHAE